MEKVANNYESTTTHTFERPIQQREDCALIWSEKLYIYMYSSKNDSNQTNKKEQKNSTANTISYSTVSEEQMPAHSPIWAWVQLSA